MWNDSHDAKIKEFLTKTEKSLLVFYIDELAVISVEEQEDQYSLKLVAQYEIPSTPVEQLFYFVKSHYSQEINSKETFHKYVQYGDFNGKHLLSLLRLCSGLYAPLFFGNNTWPDSK